jgi:hypothetical protein
MTDVRDNIVAWAKWAAANHDKFHYTQGPLRMANINRPGKLPVNADCSSFVTLCYNWAGAPDPNGQSYNHTGYTGTLLSHGRKIDLKDVLPGDVIVYGGGTGEHTALIVDVTGANAKNPLTVSHGQELDPSYCHVNQDGRKPQTYLRFNTSAINSHSSHIPPTK